jgi:hypothetical protein
LASPLPSGLLSLAAAALLALAQPAPAYRILFIGNSLTYSNDLPAMVCALARVSGRNAVCESIAKPDYSLEDHWNERDARRAIARGWDIVILQQGPSALPESRVLLIEYAKRFDGEIRKSGARTALYMVWPSLSRRGDFAGVSQSYATAAEVVNGLLLPVGDAWREAWSIDPSLALYGNDGLHPSSVGTALAAIVIYRQIFESPLNDARIRGITASQITTLAKAADQAIARLMK